MGKIKVLHIITRVVNGGADENTLFTINGLNKERYQVDLMTGEESEEEILERIKLDEEINLYQIEGLVRDISPLDEIKALRSMYRIIRDNNYDIVHTHVAKAGVLGRIAAKMAGVPAIVHGIHGITFPAAINPLLQNLYKNIERLCGSFTDKFITVGDDMQQKYIKAGVGRAEEYQTIRSGMELDNFLQAANNSRAKIKELRAELGIRADEIVIGKVSKLERRKGYRFYLAVAQEIVSKYPQVKFLIVGNGSLRSRLEGQVREMGLEENVIFTGYRQDIADVFSIFDIKVLTSLWEGLPRVLVQAAAVGKPLVSFDVDGAWEIIDEGENGYLVPMQDTETMVEKLSLLIEDKELRERMGRSAQEKVDKAWSIESMVQQTEQVYQDLIS